MSASRKICTLDRLLATRLQARAEGQTVVHCHGCFDIVHPGHISYLEYARQQGDMLIVSVSDDAQVNKGVNRPLIPADLRAGGLAALECVDYVYVNPHPTAVELLKELQPDIYVKGREYEKNHDPRFLAERNAVVGHGGKVVFSSGEVVFSSTALIHSLESQQTFNDEKLRRFRREHHLSGTAMYNLVNSFRDRKMVVIGDYILDRYHHCDTTGVAGEAPMMSLRELKRNDYDGGAGVIAAHLAALGADPLLITSLSDDELSSQITTRLRNSGVRVDAVDQRPQLVVKNRYMVDTQKLFKLDEGSMSPLDSSVEEAVVRKIEAALDDADGVILADFGYGMITGALLDRIMPTLRQRVPIITADISGNQTNLLRFKNVDLLCPTEREVRETLHDFTSGLNALAHHLLRLTGASQMMMTLGKQGLVAFDQWRPTDADESWERKLRGSYLPAFSTSAIDPLGCGDALLATASLALAAGGSLQAAAYLGSVAAAVEAQSLGNIPVTAEQILSRITFEGRGNKPRMAS